METAKEMEFTDRFVSCTEYRHGCHIPDILCIFLHCIHSMHFCNFNFPNYNNSDILYIFAYYVRIYLRVYHRIYKFSINE